MGLAEKGTEPHSLSGKTNEKVKSMLSLLTPGRCLVTK